MVIGLDVRVLLLEFEKIWDLIHTMATSLSLFLNTSLSVRELKETSDQKISRLEVVVGLPISLLIAQKLKLLLIALSLGYH